MQNHAKAHHAKKDKIQEALELLNEAAKEKKEEVHDVIGAKYEHLREMFSGALENGQAVAEEARKSLSKTLQAQEKKVKAAAAEWDKKIHKNPWAYVGGAALGSLVLGMILARKK